MNTNVSTLEEYSDYIAAAFKQLRWFPLELKRALTRLQLWEDVQQTCYLSAVQAKRASLELRETSNLAQRNLYALLRAYGFRRKKNSNGYFRAGFDTPLTERAERENGGDVAM